MIKRTHTVEAEQQRFKAGFECVMSFPLYAVFGVTLLRFDVVAGLLRAAGTLLSSGTLSPSFTHSAARTTMGRPEFLEQLHSFFSVDRPVLIQIAFLKDAFHPVRQFVLGDLAVFVGVKTHQSVDKNVDRSAGATGAIWSGLPARSAWTAGARPTKPGTAKSSAPAWLLPAESALTWPSKRRRTGGHQFINGKFSVVVSVQFFERGRRVLYLCRRNFVISVHIERHDQQVHRGPMAGSLVLSPTASWPSAAHSLWASAAHSLWASGRLRRDGDGQQGNGE